MDRRLGTLERALTYSDAYSPLPSIGVLRLERPPTLDVLRAALERLQRRHPMLRARIARERGRLRFQAMESGEVPLESIERRDDDHWQEIAERELNRPSYAPGGPLIRCTVLRDRAGGAKADRGELVVTASHTAVDGASMLRILDELLHDCAALAKGEALGAVASEPPPPSVESLYPARFRGLAWLRSAASLMVRQAAAELRYRWRTKPGAVAGAGVPAWCGISLLTLPRATTQALIRRCHGEGVSLNSAVQLAMLLADQRHFYSSQKVTLRSMAFYDLRRLLEDSPECDAVACYMSTAPFEVELPAAAESAGSRGHDARHAIFWSLAHSVQRAIRAAASRGDVFVTPSLLQPLLRAAIALKAFRLSNTALSYSGTIPLAEAYGEIVVRRLHGFTSNQTLGPEFSAWGNLFRGELHLDAMVLDADMDRAGAALLLEETRAILEDMAGDVGSESVAREGGKSGKSGGLDAR